MYVTYFFCYRNEKRAIDADIRSLCQAADERLIAFADSLNLECLEMFKDKNEGNGNENSDVAGLPQVSFCHFYIYFLVKTCTYMVCVFIFFLSN